MSGVYDILRVVRSALLTVNATIMLVRPERFIWGRIADNKRKLADRLARGNDGYFEELRTLEAYSKPAPIRTIRLFGAALLALSLPFFLISLSHLIRPE